jgi:hypothetical protein
MAPFSAAGRARPKMETPSSPWVVRGKVWFLTTLLPILSVSETYGPMLVVPKRE